MWKKNEQKNIRIAICDDDANMASEIEKMVAAYAENNLLQFEVEVYYSGEKLIHNLKRDAYFDLLFLDIEMEITDGVAVGRYIREQMQNDNMLIIYMSSHTQYAMELFQVRPMDFLVKPVSEKKMYETLDVGMRLLERGEFVFSYKQGRDRNKIPIKDILYFKGQNREIEMVTVHGTIYFYDSLAKIYDVLKSHYFVYIHKSYLINYSHVAEFYYDRLVMSNGEELKIAQGRRYEVRAFQAEMLDKEETNGHESL